MRHPVSQRIVLAATIASLILAGAALSQNAPHDRAVFKRMQAMAEARRTITRLSDMANGRAHFHPDRARIDRKALIRFARAVPGLFRRPDMDSHTRARPELWDRKSEFRVRARFALHAARGLDVRSPETLQRSLPRLLQTCLDCHTTFRRSDR